MSRPVTAIAERRGGRGPAAVWLVARVYLGYVWLTQGLRKVRDPEWMETGEAVRSFWLRAVAVPPPPAEPRVSFAWYREFLHRLLRAEIHGRLAPLLALSQVVLGLSLLAGRGTRPAALVGLVQNLGFALAGAKGHNPVMLVVGTMLVLRRRER